MILISFEGAWAKEFNGLEWQWDKGRGGPCIPGWSDFLSDCFKLKFKRWRITWYHQKPLNRKLNAYCFRFKIVEIPVRVSSDIKNRTDRDQSKKVRLHFLLYNYFSIKMIFKKWDQVQSGRSAKTNGLEIKKWTVRKDKTGRSKGRILEGMQVQKSESWRSKERKLDGHEGSKWAVQKKGYDREF